MEASNFNEKYKYIFDSYKVLEKESGIKVEQSMIKLIIAARCIRDELRTKGIFPEQNNNLSFDDVISPKLLALLGTNSFIDIYHGKDYESVLSGRGLSPKSVEEIENALKEAFDSYKEKSSTLYDVTSAINNLFSIKSEEVKAHLIRTNNSYELSNLDKAINEGCFKDSPNIYIDDLLTKEMQKM